MKHQEKPKKNKEQHIFPCSIVWNKSILNNSLGPLGIFLDRNSLDTVFQHLWGGGGFRGRGGWGPPGTDGQDGTDGRIFVP